MAQNNTTALMDRTGRTEAGSSGYILVVEDDPGIREVLDVALSEAGYRVRCLDNIEEALCAVADEAPAAALVDFVLPPATSTSLEFAAWLDARGIPVVMMSGILGGAERLGGLPYRHLAKPFRLVQLLAVVSGAMRGRR
jgi:DNA-binding response OmpR family regulator